VQLGRLAPRSLPGPDIHLGQPKIDVPAPSLALGPGLQDSFIIDAPRFFLGQPEALAPVELAVPVSVPTVHAPRLQPVSLRIPDPKQVLPTVRPVTLPAQRVLGGALRISAPDVRVAQPEALSISVPVPATPSIDLKAPVVRTPKTPSITIPAPTVGVPEIRVPAARITVASPSLPTVRVPAPTFLAPTLAGLAAAKTVAEGRVVTAARFPTVPPAPALAFPQSLERALGRLAPVTGPRLVPRVPTLPGVVEFSRRSFSAPLAVNPPLAAPGFDMASTRLSRFFRPVGNDSGNVTANINALDSADFERYMRSGNGAKAMIALSRARRGA